MIKDLVRHDTNGAYVYARDIMYEIDGRWAYFQNNIENAKERAVKMGIDPESHFVNAQRFAKTGFGGSVLVDDYKLSLLALCIVIMFLNKEKALDLQKELIEIAASHLDALYK